MPDPAQHSRTLLFEGGEVEGAHTALRRQGGATSLVSIESVADGSDAAQRAEKLDHDRVKGQHNFSPGKDATSILVHSKNRTDGEPLLQTPKRLAAAGFTPRSGVGGFSSSDRASSAAPVMTPTDPVPNTAEKVRRMLKVEHWCLPDDILVGSFSQQFFHQDDATFSIIGVPLTDFQSKGWSIFDIFP